MNTERYGVHFTPLPVGTSCKNMVHYNNQKTDMNMINRPYSDFYSFKYTQVYASFWRIINRIILNELNGILKKYY